MPACGMTSGTLGFQGYTQGPGYWGKTFYYWPPDPTKDWRTTYFTFSGGSPDNSVLWTPGAAGAARGNWQAPSSSGYQINYTAILNFIQNVGPSVFPSQLQSGRILYYTSIPSTIDTSTWPPTDLNQRFWKDYIDYVLGVMQVSSNSVRRHQQRPQRPHRLRQRFPMGHRADHGPQQPLGEPQALHALWRQSLAAHPQLLVRPHDHGRFPRQLQPLVHGLRQRLLALLLVAGHLPRIAHLRLQAGRSRRP